LSRKNRMESWNKTVSKLRKQLSRTKTKYEIGHIFRRLDATYTNLHSHIDLAEDYDTYSQGKVNLVISFRFVNVDQDKVAERVLIRVRSDKPYRNLPKEKIPQDGDELIEINGKSIRLWAKENFIYCKCNLRSHHHP